VRAASVTSWLQQTGLRKGDRVAIMMPNLLPYPVCLYGALLGGYAAVSINPLYTVRELALQLKDSGARVLFVHMRGRRALGRRKRTPSTRN